MIKLSKIKKLLHSILYPIIIGGLIYLMTKLGVGLLGLGVIVFSSLIANFYGLYDLDDFPSNSNT